MIKIAFVTIKGGLVPLIEGLCAQINISNFKLSVVLRSHLLLFLFRKKKYVKEKNS